MGCCGSSEAPPKSKGGGGVARGAPTQQPQQPKAEPSKKQSEQAAQVARQESRQSEQQRGGASSPTRGASTQKHPRALDDWREWPWSRKPEPAGGYKAKGRKRRQQGGSSANDWWYAQEFLQSFKILSAEEAQAYQAFASGDETEARRLLQQCASPAGSPTLEGPTSGGDGDYEIPKGLDERGRGGSVAAGGVDYATMQPPESSAPKSPETKQLLLQAIRKCHLFKHLSTRLNEDEVVLRAMEPVQYPEHQQIFRVGEDPGEKRGWYVVVRGSCRLTLFRRQQDDEGEGWKKLRDSDLGPQGQFGELIVANTTSVCSMNVVTTTDLQAYWLSQEHYAAVMGHTAYHRRENLKKQLRAVRLGDRAPFAELSGGEAQLAQVADALTEKYFEPGEKIIEYGEPVEHAHIILKGGVTVIGREEDAQGNTVEKEICRFQAGEDPIGFLEFLNPDKDKVERAIADVVASEGDGAQGTVTARIGRDDFERTVGDAKDILSGHADTSEVYSYYQETKKRGQRRYTLRHG
eukprot:TRINITY_DN70555_c0_g1_i1.p1 TRINITY_DN70555_c0_g1~~TRINITY_DN70555_c0_g1_i1.p1  ORF type:complete len:558 (+),score=166.51 TRINITY_DN70555_c0_g1_i1:112-1674(+)